MMKITSRPVLIVILLLFSQSIFGQVKKLVETDFTSAKECGRCHEEIYNQWSQSLHSRSLTDPIYRAVIDEMMKQTAGTQKAFCLSCHAPVSSVSGKLALQSKTLSWESFSEIEAQGVTCDFCHTVSGNENLGRNISVGAYVYPRKGTTAVKYGRYPDTANDNHRTEVSRFLTSAEFCAICHKFKHPVSGVEIQNTYEEWLKGPYSKQQGRRCQDCHMPVYSGTTVKDGKHRTELHAHAFFGGHSEMVKKAATVTAWGVQEKKGDRSRLTVTVNVTNSGAGHTIPTGLPGVREMWLEVEVLGPQGEILGQKRFRYGQRLVKWDGSEALPWEAFKTLEENRIQPRQSKQNRFDVLLPAMLRGDVKIRARLFMGLISEASSRRLNIPAPDPILAASAEATVAII